MRHLISLAFLVAAFVAYIASFGPGIAGALVFAGMFFEAAFWLRVLPARKRHAAVPQVSAHE